MPEATTNTIAELTEGILTGNGIFDVLAKAVKAQLNEEYDAERIRGTDYANAVTQSLGNVLAQAVQYSTSKLKLDAELALINAQTAKVTAESMLAVKQGKLLDKEICKAEAEIARINIETTYLVPEQVKALRKQTTLTEVNTEIAGKDAKIKQFQLDKILPVEAENLVKQGLSLTAQVAIAEKEIEVKQNQIELGIKELAIKEAQIAIAEKELLIKDEQLLITKYELSTKLPAEVNLTTAQEDLYTQKTVTEKAQVDKTVIGVGSVIDNNNKLIVEQSKVYLRNAQQNAAKMLVDTWVVRHSADPEGNLENAANKLQDADIGASISNLINNLN